MKVWVLRRRGPRKFSKPFLSVTDPVSRRKSICKNLNGLHQNIFFSILNRSRLASRPDSMEREEAALGGLGFESHSVAGSID